MNRSICTCVGAAAVSLSLLVLPAQGQGLSRAGVPKASHSIGSGGSPIAVHESEPSPYATGAAPGASAGVTSPSGTARGPQENGPAGAAAGGSSHETQRSQQIGGSSPVTGSPLTGGTGSPQGTATPQHPGSTATVQGLPTSGPDQTAPVTAPAANEGDPATQAIPTAPTTQRPNRVTDGVLLLAALAAVLVLCLGLWRAMVGVRRSRPAA